MNQIELQSNDELKLKFYSEDIPLLDVYKKYLVESGLYPNLTNHAKKWHQCLAAHTH